MSVYYYKKQSFYIILAALGLMQILLNFNKGFGLSLALSFTLFLFTIVAFYFQDKLTYIILTDKSLEFRKHFKLIQLNLDDKNTFLNDFNQKIKQCNNND